MFKYLKANSVRLIFKKRKLAKKLTSLAYSKFYVLRIFQCINVNIIGPCTIFTIIFFLHIYVFYKN